MDRLNPQQLAVVKEPGSVFISACPGSGKTRVLTYRIIRELSELQSSKHRVVAVTFTNRAADEIKSRLDEIYISTEQLWAGTIHSFALEWILRPYCCYSERLRKGFAIANEYYTRKILDELKKRHQVGDFAKIDTKLNREGILSHNSSSIEYQIAQDYHQHLVQNKLIDFDLILYISYKLLEQVPEISKTLGAIVSLICVDEYQDTQDLQYGILASIVKNSPKRFTKVFIVGDPDQAIYTSLGGVVKGFDQIKEEFQLETLVRLNLCGNYRSTQRIIDYYLNFRSVSTPIQSLTNYAQQRGLITFENQYFDKDALPQTITKLIKRSLDHGINEKEICVLAPQWWHVIELSRRLAELLPSNKFDAPGLSPFTRQRENIWFKVARLCFTKPSPSLYLVRLRWAREVVNEFTQHIGYPVLEDPHASRRFLRLLNSLDSAQVDGIPYLEDIFKHLLSELRIELRSHTSLEQSWDSFFEGAKMRLQRNNLPSSREHIYRVFNRSSGITVSTCQGIKGQEFDTVICFGLLKGYIPHWNLIFGDKYNEVEEAQKLLYVIASRAKRNLHLIAESGRETRRGDPYQTNLQLEQLSFEYDVSEES
jgi:DNA helicase II / ATP-dependent DNA helicase PcrA